MVPLGVHAFVKGRVTLVLVLLFHVVVQIHSQNSNPYGERAYNRGGVYVPPGTPGHQTYVYKDRRYGYQPSYLDPIYRGPTRAPEDRFNFGVRYQARV